VEIEWVIPCRSVDVDGRDITINGAGADRTTVAALPAEVGTTVAIRVAATIGEVQQRAIQKAWTVRGPGGDVVREGGGPESFGELPAPFREDLRTYLGLTEVVGWRAAREGVYAVEFRVGNAAPWTTEIHVCEGETR
jgi:hypothetical protein